MRRAEISWTNGSCYHFTCPCCGKPAWCKPSNAGARAGAAAGAAAAVAATIAAAPVVGVLAAPLAALGGAAVGMAAGTHRSMVDVCPQTGEKFRIG